MIRYFAMAECHGWFISFISRIELAFGRHLRSLVNKSAFVKGLNRFIPQLPARSYLIRWSVWRLGRGRLSANSYSDRCFRWKEKGTHTE